MRGTAPRHAALGYLTLLPHAVVAMTGAIALGSLLQTAALLLVGWVDDPHGWGTTLTVVGLIIVSPAVLWYLRILRRWWTRGSWIKLAIADVGYLAFAVQFLPNDQVFGPRSWTLVGLAVTASVGATLLLLTWLGGVRPASSSEATASGPGAGRSAR